MILSAKKEYVELPTLSGHASNLCRFQGRSYLTWFGGSKESADDVDIYVCRREEGQWSAPVRISAAPNEPHWNPVMLPQADHIDLFFKVGRPIARWRTMRVKLDGKAKPMGEIEELCPGDVGGRGPVKNKCLTLKSGRLLAPASLEGGRWRPFVDISLDGGARFERMVEVPLFHLGDEKPAVMDQPYCFAAGLGAIQPSLWQSGDGSVHMLMRSTEGRLLRSDSRDEGEHWCPAYDAGLPNNNSGMDLVRMDSGRIVLALNPISDPSKRSPLWLYVSEDDGKRFRPLMELEGGEGEFSYPCVIAEGRRLYVSYTWKRVRMAVWTLEMED